MHHITAVTRPFVHRPELVIALVILGVCLAALLVTLGSILLATVAVPGDGPLMAPFRWPPNHVGLA